MSPNRRSLNFSGLFSATSLIMSHLFHLPMIFAKPSVEDGSTGQQIDKSFSFRYPL